MLEHVGAEAPLVLVLEDLHWADGSTLDLVAFLAHAAREQRMLLVATYRSDEIEPQSSLRRLVAELLRAREAAALALEPLGRDELARLLVTLTEVPAARRARDRDLRALGGQSLLRRGARRGGRTGRGDASARSPRRAAAAARRPRRRDPVAAAGRCGRRPRRPVPAPRRSRTAVRGGSSSRRCAGRSSTTCSCPTSRRGRSGSATRCWPRRSTPPSCRASARSSTRASPAPSATTLPSPQARSPASWRTTGRRPGGRSRRCRRRSTRPGTQRPCRGPPRRSSTSSACSSSGRRSTIPGRSSGSSSRRSSAGRPRSPSSRATPGRPPSSSGGRSPWPIPPMKCGWVCCTSGSARSCSPRRSAIARLLWPPTCGPPSSSPSSRPRRSASVWSRRSATRSCSPGGSPSPAPHARKRSRSPTRSGTIDRPYGRSASSASISITSAGAPRGSSACGTPAGGQGSAAWCRTSSGRTSISRTC